MPFSRCDALWGLLGNRVLGEWLQPLIRSVSEVQLPMACRKVWPTLFPYCPQPPLVKTQTVTISDTANAVKSEIPTKDVPIVHTETKTITYEAAQVRLTPDAPEQRQAEDSRWFLPSGPPFTVSTRASQ